MRCLPTLLIALISAIIAAVLALYIGDAASRAHRVSDMEGGRGWLLLFCMGLGFLAGGMIGALATRIRGTKFTSALMAAGLMIAGLAAIAAAVAFLTVDSSPRIDGHRLRLEFEVLLPPGQPLTNEGVGKLTVTVVGFVDQNHATLDPSRAAPRDARLAVPGSVPITSHSEHRELIVNLGEEPQQEFELKLPRSPRRENEAWSEWIAPHYETASLRVATDREVAIRYRVQPD